MAYSDLLRDPRWQRKRLEVMQRDDFMCRECGDDSTTLNVHHGYYVRGRMPWEYELESLRTLCEPCHELLTGQIAEARQLIGEVSSEHMERVLGLLRTYAAMARWPEEWRLCDESTARVRVGSYEHFTGIAAAVGATFDELYEVLGESDTFGWEHYREIFARRNAKRDAARAAKEPR